MIDSLPLDLFGDDPDDTPPAAPATELTGCRWCSVEIPESAEFCPSCGALARPVAATTSPDPPVIAGDGPPATICQWCGAAIGPDDETCQACGWNAHGENIVTIPGLTVPMSDEQVRSVYGGDEDDDSDGVAVAIEIAGLIIRTVGGPG